MDEFIKPFRDRLTFVQKFVLFVRQQGVIGLAVAFVIGGAVQKLISSFVSDLINPLVGLMIGGTKDLKELSLTVGSATFAWGNFLSNLIDFLIIAFVIYILVKGLRADVLDKPKQ
jgi:large conductance mechanosensitive channel